MNTIFKPTLLPLVAMLPFTVTAAEILPSYEEVTTTETVVVTANKDIEKNVTKTHLSHHEIQREMIHDAKDLARYDPDLGVSDGGRFQKGFSMRGVEGNRVGILLDGMAFPDFEENSLYARYGYFNSSRQYVDLDIVKSVTLDRGASSLDAGSGALGGAVSYRTLDPSDLVQEDQTFGALGRVSYSSKNKEWTETVGAAWDTDNIDAILVYSHHQGHELDSTAKVFDPNKDKGWNSQHVDPSKHKNHSYLGKLRYNFSPEQSVGISINGQDNTNNVQEDSYQLGSDRRLAEDTNQRISSTIDYTYEPYNDLLNRVKITADVMQVKTASHSLKFSKAYGTPDERLTEDYYREFKTDFYRLAAAFESAAIDFHGEHNIDLKLYASVKEFESISDDTITAWKWWEDGIPMDVQDSYHYTIQYPVRTTNIGAVVSDNIYWEPNIFDNVSTSLVANVGARIDWAKHSPLSLNAPLNTDRNNEDRDHLIPITEKPEKTDFTNYAFQLGLDLRIEDNWKIGYQIASGFRNPTASEMYFTYSNPYGTWEANPNLEPEKSITQTLSLSGSGYLGSFDISLYQSNYWDFLMETEKWTYKDYVIEDPWFGESVVRKEVYTMQMQNHDDAVIRGIEMNGRFLFGALSPSLKGLSAMGTLGWSKGELDDGQDLLAIQPLKLVGGIDYEATNGTWGIYSRVTYLGRKKASDAVRRNADYEAPGTFDPNDGKYHETNEFETFPHLNDSATVFDIFGWWTPKKNVTLRAGIYNITDESYHTWDALRGINENSTTNSVGFRSPFIGLERYKAPGRNFAVAMEIRY